jgi:hypothetical protein
MLVGVLPVAVLVVARVAMAWEVGESVMVVPVVVVTVIEIAVAMAMIAVALVVRAAQWVVPVVPIPTAHAVMVALGNVPTTVAGKHLQHL